ncbi:PQQ-binding-like beta-propeller repeat protein [Marinagarivorans algicola]|uniref:outer membrane protein assembly factor BamB family protein n=1 Tax=Marinagarivorans algicola TaxID=1513270 RepID=UPI0006B89916|nr:PQQ-binding-like beta-propeller repeat protein [Marinagarivorans algicola]
MCKKYIKFITYLSFFGIFCADINNAVGDVSALLSEKTEDIVSIDTGHTLTKVRSANYDNQSIVVASTYEGGVIAYSKEGKLLWVNALSGYMNHDLWSADITNDNKDEILVANADGSIYCLSDKGHILWAFKKNDVPMYAVTVIKNKGKSYIVAGGYDTNIYYLDHKGKLIKTLPTSTYSQAKAWFNRDATEITKGTRLPKNNIEITNFLRPIKDQNGNSILVAHTAINSMQGSGQLHFFTPLADKPLKTITLKEGKSPIGDLRIVDVDNDGYDDVVLGSTKMKGQNVSFYSLAKDQQATYPLPKLNKAFGEFGYRVAQTEIIKKDGKNKLFILYGELFTILPVTLSNAKDKGNKKGKINIKDNSNIKNAVDFYRGKYAYNDLWRDPLTGNIILASAQSGGSNFHIVNTSSSTWEKSLKDLPATGRLAEVLDNTEVLKSKLANYKANKDVNKKNPVYLMSDYNKTKKNQINLVTTSYDSPIFLNYGSLASEGYDRTVIKNKVYRDKRDKRQKYDLSQEQILKRAKSLYIDTPGAAFWGGHGNDPFFRSLDTHKKTLKVAGDKKNGDDFP